MKNNPKKVKLTKQEKEAINIRKYPFLYKEIDVVCLDESGQSITKTIYKKKSIAPLIFLLILALFIACFMVVGLPRSVKIDQIFIIFGEMFQDTPKLAPFGGYFGYLFKIAIPKIWDTIKMVYIATLIGSIVSIPFFLLASSNFSRKMIVYQPIRAIINVIRTIPTYVLAVLCTCIMGYNEIAGIWALAVFTFGIIFKLMYEYIETCDMNPFEAMSSTGAKRGQAFMVGVWPQINPSFLSNVLYAFEINVRASVILGFVGAGGIGQELSNAIADQAFEKVGAILIPLFIVVVSLQLISSNVRKRLQ